jgi:hypothetical protein
MMLSLSRAFVFLVLSAALGAGIVFFRPANLTELKRAPSEGSDPRELAANITQVVLKQAGKQTIEEGDINAFFDSTLEQRMNQAVPFLKPSQISCDLQESTACLYLTWKVKDQPITAGVDLKLQRQGTDLTFEVLGGRYGKLEVPRFLLTPLRPLLKALAQTCQPEIQALLSLPRLSIEKEKLVLDPTF